MKKKKTVFQIRTFEVKPLSAHVRIHEIDKTRPFNTLAFSGERKSCLSLSLSPTDMFQAPSQWPRYMLGWFSY